MNKYRFIHIIWLLPLYFLLMNAYQLMVLKGIGETYRTGTSYSAEVIDFDIKQIAAQTNGYVVLSFNTGDRQIQQKLSLPVQMAQSIMNSERIPVRYQSDSYRPIVILTTYDLQKSIVWINITVTLIGLLATLVLAAYASRYANRKVRDGDESVIIERMDPDYS
ncbi:MAG: hypothetical protein WD317_04070 [Balneolaceae bacterium]